MPIVHYVKNLVKTSIPFELPIVENGEIVGSVNIIRNKAWYYKGEKANADVAQPVPDELVDEVALYKDQIAEAVAMGDDELMEKFFSGEEFTDAELTRGVRIVSVMEKLFLYIQEVLRK